MQAVGGLFYGVWINMPSAFVALSGSTPDSQSWLITCSSFQNVTNAPYIVSYNGWTFTGNSGFRKPVQTGVNVGQAFPA